MKKIILIFSLLSLASCSTFKRVSTEGFTTHKEYILYKGDTIAKLTNVEYSLDNGKFVREATFKLLDTSHGDKAKALLVFVNSTHKGWDIELDYPIEYFPTMK
jgi:hypothetical protein